MLLANLVAQVVIVVTGGLVRLTGSGLGCPTWPQCVPGSYVPVVRQPQGFHKYIEFSNRMVTLAVLVAAVAALVVTVRATRGAEHRRSRLVLGAVPLLGVVTQAMLGGLTVLTGLNPATVSAHFLLSMVLVAASSLLLLRVGLPRLPVGHLPRELAWLGRGIAAVLAVVLALGTVVTGSGPHSGDATRPARFGFDPRVVSWVHADAVWLFLGLVVTLVLALRLAAAPTALKRRAWWLLAAASSPNAYAGIGSFMSSWFGRIILFGYTWALMHHMLGGIRHFIWDTGHGFGPHEREWLAVATLVGSISLTVVIWIIGYLFMGGPR